MITDYKRNAVVKLLGAACIATEDHVNAVLDGLRYCGLEVSEKPERKPRPDAVGWWWLSLGGGTPPVVIQCVAQRGKLVLLMRAQGIAWVESVEFPLIEWAIGPLPVPEGGE